MLQFTQFDSIRQQLGDAFISFRVKFGRITFLLRLKKMNITIINLSEHLTAMGVTGNGKYDCRVTTT